MCTEVYYLTWQHFIHEFPSYGRGRLRGTLSVSGTGNQEENQPWLILVNINRLNMMWKTARNARGNYGTLPPPMGETILTVYNLFFGFRHRCDVHYATCLSSRWASEHQDTIHAQRLCLNSGTDSVIKRSIIVASIHHKGWGSEPKCWRISRTRLCPGLVVQALQKCSSE